MQSKLILSFAAAAMLFSGAAYAQDTSTEAASTGVVAACKTDIDTLCKDVGTDGRGKFKCLRENEAKVSAGCKSAMDERKAARNAVKAACKADRESLCKDVGEERGAGMKCLHDNASKVSADCGKALAALPSRS